MHRIIFDEKATDFLNKLSLEIKKRIYRKLMQTKENPHRYFERLKGRKDYKLRIGDYRAIADINDNRIEVLLIRHRKDVYKK